MYPGLDTLGYLGLITGPMFSGKTSKLLDIYKHYTFCEIPVAVINHESDNRYSNTELSTHDGRKIPCIKGMDLTTISSTHSLQIQASRVILINEGQFFNDIVSWVKEKVDIDNKIVFISGLDGDFNRQGFGTWLDLIPICDNLIKLTALCSNCKQRSGIFTQRITSDTNQILIGTEQYIPVCRQCYLTNEHNKNKSKNIKKIREDLTLLVKQCESKQKELSLLEDSDSFIDSLLHTNQEKDTETSELETLLSQDNSSLL